MANRLKWVSSSTSDADALAAILNGKWPGKTAMFEEIVVKGVGYL
jgi:hypothetical protein